LRRKQVPILELKLQKPEHFHDLADTSFWSFKEIDIEW